MGHWPIQLVCLVGDSSSTPPEEPPTSAPAADDLKTSQRSTNHKQVTVSLSVPVLLTKQLQAHNEQ